MRRKITTQLFVARTIESDELAIRQSHLLPVITASLSYYEVGTLAVDGWAVTFATARRAQGGPQPDRPLLTVPNVTAHPSTASIPITILLYDSRCSVILMWPLKG